MDFIALDFETANSYRGSICEIGIAIVRRGELIDSFSKLVKPMDNWFDPFNVSLHGIDEVKVKNEPEFNQVWEYMGDAFKNSFVLAHNASFDFSVLRHALDDYELDYPELSYSCTYQLSKEVFRGELSYGLDSLCKKLGIPLTHHRAKHDAEACAKLALTIFEEANISSPEDIEKAFPLRLGQLYKGGYKGSLKRHPNYHISDIEFDNSHFDENHPFFQKNVVFTGALGSMPRREAQKLVLEIGGICKGGVTKETDVLVLGQQDYSKYGEGFKSNKLKTAESLLNAGNGIELISERHFLELISERL